MVWNDDVMGEAVYDEENLRSRKQQQILSASEEDEQFWLEEDDEGFRRATTA